MLNNFVKRGQLFFLLSFAVLILGGTLLLMLPGVCSRPLSRLDALFTATSAVCVTGLTVVPVDEFSGFGQLLILLLIQLGGLGIMTLSVSVLLGLGRRLSMGNRFMLSTLNDDFSLHGTEKLMRMIFRYTLWCELVSAAVIFLGCLINGRPVLNALWESLFIAVSSYCNAGLCPYRDSMAETHWLSQLGSSFAIISGSLGIYVIYDLVQKFQKARFKLRVHSLVVLYGTGVLLLFGSVSLWFFGVDAGPALTPMRAFYTATASGSAGFSVVNIIDLPDVSIAICMVLMLFGGAPGSTAGGIKISTIFLVLAALWNTILGNRDVIVFKHRIPTENVMRGFAILSLFLLMASAGCLAIKLSSPDQELEHLLFEAISAICTVGLSLGNTTSELPSAGKLVVIFLMYIGRVGPFTLMLFLLGRTRSSALRYPDERILIG